MTFYMVGGKVQVFIQGILEEEVAIVRGCATNLWVNF
jgi:hypothetical protein